MLRINDETPEESVQPISVEEFERLHPSMLQAMAKAVRQELDARRAETIHGVMRRMPRVFGFILCISATVLAIDTLRKEL